jgi:hypothetical protein
MLAISNKKANNAALKALFTRYSIVIRFGLQRGVELGDWRGLLR